MDQAQLDQALKDAQLSDWEASPELLHKRYGFGTFADAMAFMQACVAAIDELDHHPEWSNVYNSVTVNLRTHDAGNMVTDKDIKLAAILDGAAAKLS